MRQRANRGIGAAMAAIAAMTLIHDAHAEPPPAEVPSPSPSDDGLEYKRSLPLSSDAESWASPGFRFALGYAFDWEAGMQGIPSGAVHNLVLRGGVRLDASWSLLVSMTYGAVTGGLEALRYVVTLDPTWHPIAPLALTFGLGFGGMFDARVAGQDAEADASLTANYTRPNAHAPLGRSDGAGVVAVLRAGWSWVLDDIWSIGVQAEGRALWIESTTDVDVGRSWELHRGHVDQSWPLLTAGLGLMFEWR